MFSLSHACICRRSVAPYSHAHSEYRLLLNLERASTSGWPLPRPAHMDRAARRMTKTCRGLALSSAAGTEMQGRSSAYILCKQCGEYDIQSHAEITARVPSSTIGLAAPALATRPSDRCISPSLRYAQGRLAGHMDTLGFALR